jgi:predicted TPR repeat methyltransferase
MQEMVQRRAYTNLGMLLSGLKWTEEAAACYCKAIALRPKHPETRKLLALAHCTLGEVDDATRVLKQWLEEEPGNPIARHMLAACTGRDVPERASNGFVETTFDSFAASFEAKLARLSYRAPALVAAMLEDCGLQPSHRLDVLDAGCGTGVVARSSRLLRAGCSAWTCPKACWHMRWRRASTTSFLKPS